MKWKQDYTRIMCYVHCIHMNETYDYMSEILLQIGILKIVYLTYLASRNMSFKSKLARNINIFECNLISVMACGGNE